MAARREAEAEAARREAEEARREAEEARRAREVAEIESLARSNESLRQSIEAARRLRGRFEERHAAISQKRAGLTTGSDVLRAAFDGLERERWAMADDDAISAETMYTRLLSRLDDVDRQVDAARLAEAEAARRRAEARTGGGLGPTTMLGGLASLMLAGVMVIVLGVQGLYASKHNTWDPCTGMYRETIEQAGSSEALGIQLGLAGAHFAEALMGEEALVNGIRDDRGTVGCFFDEIDLFLSSNP